MGGGGGGSDRGSYFVPKKITTSAFVYPKKSLLFSAYPKNLLSPFFTTKKISLFFFCDPKKSQSLKVHRDDSNHYTMARDLLSSDSHWFIRSYGHLSKEQLIGLTQKCHTMLVFLSWCDISMILYFKAILITF